MSVPVRLLAAVGGAAVMAAAATAGTLHVQDTQRTEHIRLVRTAEARTELQRQVTAHAGALAGPASDGHEAAAELRLLLAETVTGWERDDDAVRADLEKQVEQLRDAADRLAALGLQPVPRPPRLLEADTVQPVLERLEALGDHAMSTATRLRAAADEAATVGTTAHALHVEAAQFAGAASQLPADDDPDVVAEAWRDELDRLDAYAEAVDAAADVERLAELAAAHRELVDEFRASAETAVEHLDDGDVDAYNRHREAQLERASAFGALLLEAMDATLPRVVADVEAAEEYALGLLSEVERLEATVTGRLQAALPTRPTR